MLSALSANFYARWRTRGAQHAAVGEAAGPAAETTAHTALLA